MKKLWNEKTLTFIIFPLEFGLRGSFGLLSAHFEFPQASQGKKYPAHDLAGERERDIHQIPISGKIYKGVRISISILCLILYLRPTML